MSVIDNTNNISPTLSQIKAHPSVYSPNEGNFNSEDNLKWLANKLATKPFIIGKSNKDIKNNLKPVLKGNKIGIADGLFSIEGYTFKLASDEDPNRQISFDAPLDTTSENVIVDTFAGSELINEIYTNTVSSDTYSVNCDFDSMCFDIYKPSSHTDTDEDWEILNMNWNQAAKDSSSIGYIKLRYVNAIASVITKQDGKASYGPTSITIIDDTYQASVEDENGLADPDAIEQFIENQEFNTYGLTNKDPFAIVESETVIDIYYPVFVRLHNDSTKSNKLPIVYFKDIFGIEFLQSQSYETDEEVVTDESTPIPELYTTNYYPNTNSYFFEMGGSSTPLGNFTNCDKESYPNKAYQYQTLYNNLSTNSFTRKVFSDTGSASYYPGTSFPSLTDIKESENSSNPVFIEKTLTQLVSLMPDSGNLYDSIENTASYYCLNIPDEMLQTVPGKSTKVPVVFMCSNGTLCPNGIIVDNKGTTVTSEYPAEGYVHFIKRRYLIDSSDGSSDPTEEQINNLTMHDVCIGWAGFPLFYDTYIAKPLSIYFALCYSSLMENCIFKVSGQTSTQAIKASGCGVALAANPPQSLVLDDQPDKVVQTYTYTGYEKNQGGQIVPVATMTSSIPYYKNVISDKDLIKGAEMPNQGKESIFGTIKYMKGIPSAAVTIMNNASAGSADRAKVATLFDDPINYMQKCTKVAPTGDPTISSVTLYMINYANSYVTSTEKQVFTSVILNEDALPTTPNVEVTGQGTPYQVPYATKYQLAGRFLTNKDSLSNSMRFYFDIDSWYGSIWEVINIKKDAQGYLCGRKISDSDPTIISDDYDGIHFEQKVRNDFEDDDLGIYDVKVSSKLNMLGTGQGVNDKYILYSDSSNVIRGAYIHIDKVYGDDDKSLRQILRDIMSDADVDLSELLARIAALEENVEGILNLIGDTTIEGTITENIANHTKEINKIKPKLNPYIVTILNLGENKENPGAGQPTDSVIAEVYNNGDVIIKGEGATDDFTYVNPSPLTTYDPTDSDYYFEDETTLNAVPSISPIKHITILPGVTYLGDRIFAYITENSESTENTLIGVEIPESVCQLGNDLFIGLLTGGNYYPPSNLYNLPFGPNYYTTAEVLSPKYIQFTKPTNVLIVSQKSSYNAAPFECSGVESFDLNSSYIHTINLPYIENGYHNKTGTNPGYENNYKLFGYSYNLIKVDIDSEAIPQECFVGCFSLRQVNISNRVKRIGLFSFWGTGLSRINFNTSIFDLFNVIDSTPQTSVYYGHWNTVWPADDIAPGVRFTSKNHLPITAESTTESGVRIAVKDDGTIHLNGTSTADIDFDIVPTAELDSFQLLLPEDHEYTLCGCPEGGSSSTYSLNVTTEGVTYSDYGVGVRFTPTPSSADETISTSITVKITIKSGQTFDDVVFKPMICRSKDYKYSPDFESYIDPNTSDLLLNGLSAKEISTNDISIYGIRGDSKIWKIKLNIIPEEYFDKAKFLGTSTPNSIINVEELPSERTQILKSVQKFGKNMFKGQINLNIITYEGTAVGFRNIAKWGLDIFDWAGKSYTISGDNTIKYMINGYYNSTDGKFYEDVEYTTEITGTDNYLYISLAEDSFGYIYQYNAGDSEYQRVISDSQYCSLVKVICTGDIADSIFIYDRDQYRFDGEFKLVNYRGVEGDWVWSAEDNDYVL